MGTMTYPRILLFRLIGLSILHSSAQPGKPFNAHADLQGPACRRFKVVASIAIYIILFAARLLGTFSSRVSFLHLMRYRDIWR